MAKKRYKFSSYQIMVLEKAAKEGNYIVFSMCYDFQHILSATGEHVYYFKRPTFDILLKTKCIELVPGSNGKRYVVTEEIKKLLSL